MRSGHDPDRGLGRGGVGREARPRLSRAARGRAGRGLRPGRPMRAREVAERYGCRAFAGAEELLAACDAVSIAVPTVEHRAAAERAAAAGRHVLVEKPMAVTVEEADAMIAAARRARVVLQVGQVERFNPALLAARPHVRGAQVRRGAPAGRVPAALARRGRRLRPDDPRPRRGAATWWASRRCRSRPSAWRCSRGTRTSRTRGSSSPSGCVANLTASRVSQDRLRRIRFFQGDAYLSVDLFEKTCDLLHVDAVRLRAVLGRGAGRSRPRLAAIDRRRLEVVHRRAAHARAAGVPGLAARRGRRARRRPRPGAPRSRSRPRCARR